MRGGNHFLEIQRVQAIFDADAARALGLRLDQITVLIHTGSRGLGHQVCTDHVRRMDAALARHRITLPDRQLACAPLSSLEGQDYLAAMSAAANFAFANREVLTHRVRQVFASTTKSGELDVIYDVAHNVAKIEEHLGRSVCVHRKGATRAFGPGAVELPEAYRAVGQPVLIPGSMGTSSFVLVGRGASELSFASACHGAGRAMSRTASKQMVRGGQLRKELEARGGTPHPASPCAVPRTPSSPRRRRRRTKTWGASSTSWSARASRGRSRASSRSGSSRGERARAMHHDDGAMRDEFYRVKPWAGGWGVFASADDLRRTEEAHRTRADAVIHAKELARRAGGAQILVYGEHGELDSEFFYQPDERPALADDDSIASFAATRPVSKRRSRPRP